MKKSFVFLLILNISIIISSEPTEHMKNHSAKMHGPIGIMSDHLLNKGKSMISIRYMKMSMDQNYLGSNKISDQLILELPNPTGMPKNLSVVPQEMDMDMVMLGGMYAPSDYITLMGMIMLEQKSMDLRSYKPMITRDMVGDFTMRSSGLSSISMSLLFKILDRDGSKFHAQLGMENSSSKNDLKDNMLTPMGAVNEMILPYGMQLGDESYTLLSALIYSKTYEIWKFSSQIKSRINVKNDQWNFGDSYETNLWLQRDLNQITAWSLRLKFQDIGSIKGNDKNISAPVQTSNPFNYGGKILTSGIGLNIMLPKGSVGLELYKPITQDLHGPQMGMNWGLQVGYHLSF